MSREVYVHPHQVHEHRDNLRSSISSFETASKFDNVEMEHTQLRSITKLKEVIASFEEAMTLYAEMCNRDVDKVDLVKESLIEQDERLADFRIFTNN